MEDPHNEERMGSMAFVAHQKEEKHLFRVVPRLGGIISVKNQFDN